jgi:DNA modification methylase
MWEIRNNDCNQELRNISNATLIFADPPYNIGVNYGNHYNDNVDSFTYRIWCEKWLLGCYNSLTPNGSLWLLNSHENVYRLYNSIRNTGFHIKQPIIWYETFGVNCVNKFNLCSRTLLWLVKNKKDYIFNASAPEIRQLSAREAVYNDKRANPGGKLLDDVWIIPRLAGTHKERISGFPTQLPEKLIERVVAAATNTGDLVVDPFSGSGTTVRVCIRMNRPVIGIELSSDYANLSRSHIDT